MPQDPFQACLGNGIILKNAMLFVGDQTVERMMEIVVPLGIESPVAAIA